MTKGSKLLTTGAAARVLGVDPSTLSRWAQAGTVAPAGRTAGGHLRWDLDKLQAQLAEIEAPGKVT